MTARKLLSFLLVGCFFVILGLSMNTTVQADPVLQDVPRLDGVNIYFTESAGEASRFDRSGSGLSHFGGLLGQLGANLYTLEWRTGIPADTDLIVIAGPTADLTPDQIARLWLYLSKGGRLLLLANTLSESRPQQRALPSAGGVFSLMWADLGLRGRDDVVVTGESGAPATDQPLVAQFTTAQWNTSDPTTQNLTGALAFSRARSLEVDASVQSFHATPLIFTSDQFYGEINYAQYLQDGTWEFNIGTDTTFGALPLAAASESTTTGARVVVIGDREFATNGAGLNTSPINSPSFVYPDNARFLLNATTWLLGKDPVSMDFPTPAPTATATLRPSPTPAASLTPTPAS
jgi:hypothetical protein